MIKRINKYLYWLILTLIVTTVLVMQSHNYTQMNMAMIFLLTLAFLTLIHLLLDVIFKFRAPAYFKYHEDIFYDIQWNWDWNLKKEILHLKPTCPTCKSEVYYNFDTLLYKTEFVCEKCNKQLANINSSNRNFVVESVKKSIIRKLTKEDASF